MIMNLSDQMAANFMASTGGLKMRIDNSRPGMYDRTMNPMHDYTPNYPAYEPVKHVREIVHQKIVDLVPVVTLNTHEPEEKIKSSYEEYLDRKSEELNDSNVLRDLRIKLVPDYSDL